MHASRVNKYTPNVASLVVMEIMHQGADSAWDLGTVFFVYLQPFFVCGEKRCVTTQKWKHWNFGLFISVWSLSFEKKLPQNVHKNIERHRYTLNK